METLRNAIVSIAICKSIGLSIFTASRPAVQLFAVQFGSFESYA